MIEPHFEFAWRLRYLFVRFNIGKYTIVFAPYLEWQNADRNFSTWFGQYRFLKRNIFEFGPFRFIQHHEVQVTELIKKNS